MKKVYLVGAGCGEGSISIRGAELLKQCDCVVYDSLIDAGLLALCKPSCRRFFVGKRAGRHAMRQEEIDALLVECGKKYPVTVRLKGGDPFVFGRGGEEMLALKEAGVYAQSVAGVTSAVAAAEAAGIPVTYRGLSRGFHVVTAHTADACPDFSRLANEEDTLIFLMGKSSAPSIQSGLLAGGMDKNMPAAVVSAAGTKEFCSCRTHLAKLAETAEKLPAPMVIVVGKVCALDVRAAESNREEVGKVVVTGTAPHIERVLSRMEDAGVSAVGLTTLCVKAHDFGAFFERMAEFSLLVFTSANGVETFFREVLRRKLDLRAFGDKKFAVIGRATESALVQKGFYADCMPEIYTGEALADAVCALGIAKEKTALLRSASGGEALKKAGVQFDLYDTEARPHWEEEAERILSGAACVTFSSAGGVREFFGKCKLPPGALPVAIGEETARELKKRGYCPEVAEISDADGLVGAVLAAKEKRR